MEKLLDQSVQGWREDIDRHAIASGDHEDGEGGDYYDENDGDDYYHDNEGEIR